MNDLGATLRQCVERVAKYRKQPTKIGEQNTKAGLIEPVLAALGWDLVDADEVNREYRRRSSDNPVDYALLLLRTPRLFVEAKGLGENLNDPKWTNQTISYAAVAGVEWVALTDGAEWRIYNAHAPVPAEEKLFRSVRLDEDLDEAIATLTLLGKAEIGDNRIEELWRSQFDDKRVHATLQELFDPFDPPRELVNLIAKRVPSLDRAAVKLSLRRVRVRFDFPSGPSTEPPRRSAPHVAPDTAPRPIPAISVTGHSATAAHKRSAKPKVSAREKATKLGDLIRLGAITSGAEVVTTYMGQQYRAEVTSEGMIRFQNEQYNSPSKAGEAVKIAARGKDLPPSIKATDGWSFWKMQTPDGLRSLSEIRRGMPSAHP